MSAKPTIPPNEFQCLKYDVSDHIALITLNRPERRNALNRRAYDELEVGIPSRVRRSAGALRRRYRRRSRVLLRRGRQGDDDRREEGAASDGASSADSGGDGGAGMRLPVIAAVNGSAVGWGMELALYADIRLASEKANFAELFIRRGLICDVGGLLRLPAIVGPAKAAELLYTGDVIDAAEAGRIGLVSEVTPHADLMPKAMDSGWSYRAQFAAGAALHEGGPAPHHPWRSARDWKLGHRGHLQAVRHRGSPRGRAQLP